MRRKCFLVAPNILAFFERKGQEMVGQEFQKNLMPLPPIYVKARLINLFLKFFQIEV